MVGPSTTSACCRITTFSTNRGTSSQAASLACLPLSARRSQLPFARMPGISPVLWNGLMRESPLASLSGAGISLLVNLSASPFSLGRPQRRMELFKSIATSVGVPVLFCNQVAGNDELLFDGCSLAVMPDGKLAGVGKAFEEDLLFVDTRFRREDETGVSLNFPPWPKSEGEWLFRALCFGLKDYAEKCGTNRACLGLSGGIDSSVVAAIAVSALGKENVSGLSMPTRFTSSPSVEDAITMSENSRMGFPGRLH